MYVAWYVYDFCFIFKLDELGALKRNDFAYCKKKSVSLYICIYIYVQTLKWLVLLIENIRIVYKFICMY